MGTHDAGRVTLVVVSFNHENYLPDLLASIDAQTFRPAAVILCDDCSDDSSASVLRAWARRSEVPTRLLLHTVNIGLNATLNEALALVDTPLYAYISGDDVMEPGRISAQAEVLDASEHAFVYGDATVIDEQGYLVAPSFIEMMLRGTPRPEDSFESLLHVGNWIPACSVLVRTEAVRSAGGFDESLFFEDYDLWLRLARGHTFTHVPAPLVRFRKLGTSMGSSRFDDANDEWQWSKIRIRAKHFGHSRATDELIARTISPWAVTLAARSWDRRLLAPLFRRAFLARPTFRSACWAAVASVPMRAPLLAAARRQRPVPASVE